MNFNLWIPLWTILGDPAVGIQYELDKAEIAGKNCPIVIDDVRISEDGRDITIDRSNWRVSLDQPTDGLLADSTCLLRIPARVPAAYQVLHLTQDLGYSYAKGSASTIGIYGNAKLFELGNAPIEIQLGAADQGQHYGILENSSANLNGGSTFCQGESTLGFLAINLGISIIRSKRDQTAWVELAQPRSPYHVQFTVVPCTGP